MVILARLNPTPPTTPPELLPVGDRARAEACGVLVPWQPVQYEHAIPLFSRSCWPTGCAGCAVRPYGPGGHPGGKSADVRPDGRCQDGAALRQRYTDAEEARIKTGRVE